MTMKRIDFKALFEMHNLNSPQSERTHYSGPEATVDLLENMPELEHSIYKHDADDFTYLDYSGSLPLFSITYSVDGEKSHADVKLNRSAVEKAVGAGYASEDIDSHFKGYLNDTLETYGKNREDPKKQDEPDQPSSFSITYGIEDGVSYARIELNRPAVEEAVGAGHTSEELGLLFKDYLTNAFNIDQVYDKDGKKINNPDNLVYLAEKERASGLEMKKNLEKAYLREEDSNKNSESSIEDKIKSEEPVNEHFDPSNLQTLFIYALPDGEIVPSTYDSTNVWERNGKANYERPGPDEIADDLYSP